MCADKWFASLPAVQARIARTVNWELIAVGGIAIILLGPYAPITSGWWNISTWINPDWKEEVGWPELVQIVAGIDARLPSNEQAETGILGGNYGDAGAIDLYGPAYGLPQAISGIDSYWWRGYGDPAPGTLIVVGYDDGHASSLFQSCVLAGHVSNAFGVKNEETTSHPDIFVCRGPRQTWQELWKRMQTFG